MRVGKFNPSDVHKTPGYHHVTVVEAGRMAFLAGQCPLDLDGNLVGTGDHLLPRPSNSGLPADLDPRS
ncbi:hypothetical protein WME85_40145 [Sorangium sp. So ce1153]